MDPCSRPGCRRLPTFLAALGLTLLIALGTRARLPGAAEPVVCNANMNIDLTTPHNFLIPPESYTVTATMTSGNISGGTASINKFRFELDCDPDNQLFIGCSNTGNSPAEVNYDGDTHISAGTTCVDSGLNQLFVISNVPAGGSATNQIVFTFVNDLVNKVPTPLHLAENDTTGCTVTFQVSALAHDDNLAPGTVDRLEHVLGFDAVLADATCSNGGVSGSSQTGFINLCPVCDDNNACTTDVCNQSTGVCSNTPITCNDNN